MAFTSQLGKADSRLGNIELGKLSYVVTPANNSLSLSQTVVVQVVLNVNATSTLVQTDETHSVNPYLQRIVSGLVARENFTSLTGWTNVGAEWSSVANPGMISYPSPKIILDRGVEGVDADGGGIREPHLVVIDRTTWHLFADAGDGSDPVGANGPWQIKRYSTTDRGENWTRHGNISLVKTGSAYSGYVSFDMAGWITKVGSTYYMQVLVSNTLIDGRVPNVPYVNSVYTASSLSGPWTWSHDSPALGGGGSFDETTATISHVFHDGSQYVGYYAAKSTGSAWGVGRATTSSLASAWTKDGAGQVLPSAVWLDSSFENPKIWYSNILNKWLMVGNGNVRDTEELFIASTEADFRTSDVKRLQIMQLSSPMYTRNTLSIISPVSRESGDIWQETDDVVPFVYAGDRDSGAPNNFEWHRIRAGQLEPYTHTAKYDHASNISYLTKTDPLVAANSGDGIYEFQFEPQCTGSGKNIGFLYRSTGGTADASTTGYLLNIETNTWKAQFYKNASGVFTQLGTDFTLPYRFEGDARNSNTCRVKIVTSGSNHKIYINGTLAFDPVGGGGGVNDATYTGSLYGFRGVGGTFNIRGLIVRKSDTVTVTGVLNGVKVSLHGPSGYLIDSVTSTGAPVLLTIPYGNAFILHASGHDDTYEGKIWGGDEFTLLDTGEALSYYQYYQTMSVATVLNISVSNTLVQSQQALGFDVKEGINTLVLSQSVDVTNSKPTINTLALTQFVTITTSPHNISVTSVLPIGHQLAKNTVKSYKASNAIGFNQTLKKWKQFDIDIDTPITWTQSIVRERFNRDIDTSIVFGQTLVGQKVISRSVVSTLTQSQLLASTKVINRSLENELIFLPNHIQYIPVGGIGNVTIDNLLYTIIHQTISPSGVIFQQGPNGVFISIPQTPKKIPPYCTLSVPERTITLPAPEWNDSEAYSGIFTIRRSMVGGTFTYVHRLDSDKLHYEFVFGLRKARELKDYLLYFNSRVHTLINWKGEIWYVFLTNNPFELLSGPRYSNSLNDANDDREKIRIVMEFEGKRIN